MQKIERDKTIEAEKCEQEKRHREQEQNRKIRTKNKRYLYTKRHTGLVAPISRKPNPRTTIKKRTKNNKKSSKNDDTNNPSPQDKNNVRVGGGNGGNRSGGNHNMPRMRRELRGSWKTTTTTTKTLVSGASSSLNKLIKYNLNKELAQTLAENSPKYLESVSNINPSVRAVWNIGLGSDVPPDQIKHAMNVVKDRAIQESKTILQQQTQKELAKQTIKSMATSVGLRAVGGFATSYGITYTLSTSTKYIIACKATIRNIIKDEHVARAKQK